MSLYDENGKCQYPQQLINKLAEYENSGYEPEELNNMGDTHIAPKGCWLINPDGYYPYCSRCHQEPNSGDMTKFCPNCGADMRHTRKVVY